MTNKEQLIVLTGGAGLVGQNLLIALTELGFSRLVVIDKHEHNLQLVARLHPQVIRVHADLSQPGEWQSYVQQADTLVMLQAQIGNTDSELFLRNNVTATERILESAQTKKPYLVHISSSVVNSKADDDYVKSKTRQEELVRSSNLDWVILRPTLMFGHFDRKHLGWLSRFMSKTPIFPVPGNGRYTRQPLYAMDFCNIIVKCIEQHPCGTIYNISGREKIDYIDMIKTIRSCTGARSWIVKLPYSLFYLLLKIYAIFDNDPPFTTHQLQALVIDETFELIDWETIFNIQATPFYTASRETYSKSKYSEYILEF